MAQFFNLFLQLDGFRFRNPCLSGWNINPGKLCFNTPITATCVSMFHQCQLMNHFWKWCWEKYRLPPRCDPAASSWTRSIQSCWDPAPCSSAHCGSGPSRLWRWFQLAGVTCSMQNLSVLVWMVFELSGNIVSHCQTVQGETGPNRFITDS